MTSPELQAQIAVWRAKALDGTLTDEEMIAALKPLRGDRIAAAQATSTARRTKAVKAIPTAADLLGELGELP